MKNSNKRKPKEMPFFQKIEHLEGRKIKEIKQIDDIILVIFNNRFGEAFIFTDKGKFKGITMTTKYMSKK